MSTPPLFHADTAGPRAASRSAGAPGCVICGMRDLRCNRHHAPLASPPLTGQKRRMSKADETPPHEPQPRKAAGPHPDILCIGSVLWDVIGHSASHMAIGADVPGRITRQPGGVALNIALTLTRFSLTPALLTVLGRDHEGRALADACRARGLVMDHAHLSEDLPTDRYMAIEAANGLIAAIADAHSLEAAGARILAPLREGPLATTAAPWEGPIALDGNLTEALLGGGARLARQGGAPPAAPSPPARDLLRQPRGGGDPLRGNIPRCRPRRRRTEGARRPSCAGHGWRQALRAAR